MKEANRDDIVRPSVRNPHEGTPITKARKYESTKGDFRMSCFLPFVFS